MDVVSLLPSATEICYALGVEPVGVSHECDHPPAATDQPTMSYSVVDGDGSSAEVDEAVAEAEADNGVYAIDHEALAAAAPDLILTQGVCDVCAVDHVLVADAVEQLAIDAEILTLDPHSLADVFADVERVGDAVGRADRAKEVVAALRRRVEAVSDRVGDVEDPPRVAVLDWMDPVMVAGHWIPEMVEMAGGRYGLEEAGGRSRPREWAEIRSYDPEVLVAAPCGFDLGQTETHLDDLTGRAGWSDLAAVENGRAYAMDGHHHVNRPGPRLVDTLEHLVAVIGRGAVGTPPQEVVRPLSTSEASAD
jgi:iron complex transport system substrate-binding protein